MATNAMMDGGAQRDRQQLASRATERDNGVAGRRPQRLGTLASSMREVVRETVYATYDALRGRYDR